MMRWIDIKDSKVEMIMCVRVGGGEGKGFWKKGKRTMVGIKERRKIEEKLKH